MQGNGPGEKLITKIEVLLPVRQRVILLNDEQCQVDWSF